MKSLFSVDDFSDSFLSSSSSAPASFHALPMNRSQSEWEFEKFLEEVTVSSSASSASGNSIPAVIDSSVVSKSRADQIEDDDVAEINKSHRDQSLDPLPPVIPSSSAPVDSDEYRAYLKSKLDLACAAVALMAAPGKPEESSLIDNQTQAAKPSELGSQATVNISTAYDVLVAPPKADGRPLGSAVLPAIQGKLGTQVRQSMSGSSREDSDVDELEGDTETTEDLDPLDDKRARRMLSNRESARRSRRRKQAHLTGLETQAGQLRVEHSSLLKGLTDVNQKYDESAVNNRILKADIETLRTKVKMAEETVKRVTGLNPLPLARTDVPGVGMPSINSPLDASPNAAVPMQPNPNEFFNQAIPTISTTSNPNHHRMDSGFPGNSNNNTQIPAVGRPAGALPDWDTGRPLAGDENERRS